MTKASKKSAKATAPALSSAEAHYLKGSAFLAKEDAVAAIKHFSAAVAIKPDYAMAMLNWGNALYFQGKIDKAALQYQNAILADPNYAEAYHNLGLACTALHDHHGAIRHYRQALALNPDYVAVEVGLSGSLLKTGQWREGWRHYEKRWEGFQNSPQGTLTRPQTSLPQWRGEQVAADASLLLFCEQGLGDSLQFVRYLPMLAERFKQITFICQPELLSLMQRSFSGLGVEITSTIPNSHQQWNWHCTTMSLPLAFATTLDNLPAKVPYLRVSSQLVDRWKQQLDQATVVGKPRVGLLWSGGQKNSWIQYRSMHFSKILPLIKSDKVNWVSLQLEKTEAISTSVRLIDCMDEVKDMADTAAIIENLDLVISIDTAVAHLAGALGKPVWLLNYIDPDWRWLMQRDDSPWYPSMRLFTQRMEGDWDEVISRVNSALDSWVENMVPPTTTGATSDEMNNIVALFNAANWKTLEDETRRLCQKHPQDGFAWKCLGVSLKMQGKNVEALDAMKKAVALMPEDTEAHKNLAVALRETGDVDSAIEHLKKVLHIMPDDHETGFSLANILRDREQFDEALTLYNKVLMLKPDYAAALVSMGLAMLMQRMPDAALLQFQKALNIAPDLAEALNAMGSALRALGEIDQAITYYRRALELYPNYHDVYHNIAMAYSEKNDLDSAIDYCTKVLALKPDYASAETSLGMALLAKGDLAQGWRHYEKRWDGFLQAIKGPLQRPATSLPQWRGEAPGKQDSLLLFCEQGLGDNLHFIRYLPLLAERFAKITLVCPDLLLNILRCSFQAENIEIIDYFPDSHAAWQWHCTTLSLPLAFNTTLENIPNALPYLQAPDNLVRYWKNRLQSLQLNEKPCIGVVWSGNPYNTNIKLRNMRFSNVAPLLELQQFNWISLQKDKGEPVDNCEQLLNWMDEIEDFTDTAALIENLDLVISVDTSVVHLAGALGKPVWMLNRLSGDWRWLDGREDSPWYPGMKIFTQKSRSDWDGVINRVIADLSVAKDLCHRGKKRHTAVTSKPLAKEINTVVALFNAKNWLPLEQAATRLTERYPQDGFGFNSLGIALKMQKKHAQALPVLRQAAKLMVNDAEVHNNLANALSEQYPEEAIEYYEKALKINPGYVEALHNLGISLRNIGRTQEAIDCFRKALVMSPNYAEVQHNLGIALDTCKQYDEAAACYRKALSIKPNYLEACHNLANALYHLGRYDEALAYFQKVLDVVPDYAESRFSRSLILLSMGQFEQGWQDYDLRFKRKKPTPLADTPYPRYLGVEPLAGKKLLIQFEQGFGDAFQMLRYVNLLEQQGAKCWIQAPESMRSLLTRSFANATIIGKEACPSGLDYRIPVMSMPLALETFCETAIPSRMPYLLADSKKIALWRKQLASSHVYSVGLVWRGNPEHQNDYNRSINLADLLPLIEMHPSIQFVSLQKNLMPDELALLQDQPNLHVLDSELANFDDTAAVMATLALVISIDSAPAHLAAALGKPTWLLLPFRADWRWMLEREDSPWYPSMRLFRQQTPADWNAVLGKVTNGLRLWTEQGFLPALPAATGSTYEEAVENLLQLFNTGMLKALAQSSQYAALSYPDDAFAANMLTIALALQQCPDLTAVKNQLAKLRPASQTLPLAARILREVQAVEEAVANFATSIAEQCDFTESLHRLAATLLIKSNNSGAITYYLKVVALNPVFVEAWINLATAYLRQGDAANALKYFQEALKLRPDSAHALNGIAAAYKDMNELTKAIEYFRRGLRIDPTFSAAETGLAMSLLTTGQLREGWQYYESRWQGLNTALEGNLRRPKTSLPQWKGEPPAKDAKLLLFCEQGLGDTIQFIRYAILAKQHFAGITVVCPPPLLNLLRGSLQGSGIEVQTKIPSDHAAWQWHCTTMSMPLACDTTLNNIPASVPYLSAPTNRVEYWGNRLNVADPQKKLRIGLVWAGNSQLRHDAQRSINTLLLRPLLANSGVLWVSVQKTDNAAQKLQSIISANLIDWMEEITDLADTAALIACLDLVISVDTSVAHLAGALGKPVWMLNRFAGDWRWIAGRDDSPWYPTMRIFTQKSSGDWDEVLTRVIAALESWRPQSLIAATPAINDRVSAEEINAIVSAFNTQSWPDLEQLADDLCQRYPDDGFGFKSLGVALKMQNKDAQALDVMRKAASLMPDDADVHNNLGGILNAAGDSSAAISHFETALKIKPKFVEALNNLGAVYCDLAQVEKAIGFYQQVLQINPDSAIALYNMGVASRELRRNADAIHYYQQSLAIRPNDVETLWNLSMALLSSGQFERGWRQYEIRFARSSKKPLAQTPYPCWLGEQAIAGKKILIQSEQGFGDAFQMLRYLPLLEKQGAECWIQLPKTMHSITSRSFATAHIVTESEVPAGLDLRIPLMSLPLAMQSFSEQAIPKAMPYLMADSDRIAYWQQQLATASATVGIVWRGNPGNANDSQRSIPLSKFLPLLSAHPLIQFVSLQKDLTATERTTLKGCKNLRVLDSELSNFDETAAIMANLGMTIAVDTAPVHLSGALARPTWLLLSFKVDWRWLVGRDDSPWYPTMRLFNQAKVGDWDGVIAEVSAALGREFK